MEHTFTDFYYNEVRLSFTQTPFSKNPKHVWVICRYKNKWLLTAHHSRGWEFPGGKVEPGERPEEAAVREVMEETGAKVAQLYYVGQYFVAGKGGDIIKNIYFAEVAELIEREHYFETEGPVLLHVLPSNIREDKQFSFIMKDDVLTHSIAYITENILAQK